MPEADCGSGRQRRFAVACSVLSRCVRAEAVAAAGNMAAAAAAHGRSEAHPAAAASTMLLMPGADVAREETTAAAATTPAPAQMTILYGGCVLVFDGVPAFRAAEVMRAAARQDLQVARKASLQRLLEKRRERVAPRAPYAPARQAAAPPKVGREEGDAAGSWLELGTPRGCAC
ncbi:unnamed protein product [Urochloa decumbens]|uniref:Protein TIFY n=1 Tax=Urochloa decumbens TaxID=240449 RepID=A0ABC8WYF7_9POAL